MSVDGLLIAHDGPVLRLTLDRPTRKNALTDEIVLTLIETIDAAGPGATSAPASISGPARAPPTTRVPVSVRSSAGCRPTSTA